MLSTVRDCRNENNREAIETRTDFHMFKDIEDETVIAGICLGFILGS